MPLSIVAALIALGCRATVIETPIGPAASVWICPPPIAAPAEPGREEREE